MSKKYYNLKCKKCGNSPIKIKKIDGHEKSKSKKNTGTFYICVTKCGRIEKSNVIEI